MTDAFKKQFPQLKIIGQRAGLSPAEKQIKDLQLVGYLESVIAGGDVRDFEALGFCFWNISDSYALLRDGKKLLENHKRFYRHVKTGGSPYLFWLCCDATQRFTLEKDGHGQFWWDIYHQAAAENSGSTSVAEYHTHKAALSVNPLLPHGPSDLDRAMQASSRFLEKQKHSPDHRFYRAIFSIMQARFTGETAGIASLTASFLSDLGAQTSHIFLPGEWQGFTAPIPPSRQANLVSSAGINTLIYAGKLAEAKALYTAALSAGFPKNNYIERRLP